MNEIYRGMDRAALDAAYNNTQAVANFDAVYADFQARSAHTYATVACQRDIAYGPQASERFDWFPNDKQDAPVFIFIHGGYWTHTAKEAYAFIAKGPLECGFSVVLAEYTLAPQATMTEIVAQIGRLLDHLAADPDGLGTAKAPIYLSGHSAGGHLAAMHRSHPQVKFVLPISGLFDLEPISLCWLNEKLSLTPQEIDAYSPLRCIGKGAPMIVSSGAAELPELVRQSREYVQACAAAGEKVTLLAVPGCTHFTMLEDLAMSSGQQMTALVQA
ncbi:alpha/beta hydrolase [Neisseriaceae bacterium TC5R-5]|nr:alpha/beta hydrolase [Neisseriaceae bacterium TC5R-5]